MLILGNSGWLPYQFVGEDGEPDGFSVDLAEEICDRRGWSCRIVLYDDWPRAQEEVLAGRADLLLGMTKTRERMDRGFLVSSDILEMTASIFVRTETVDVHGLADLQGSVVAAVAGSPYDTELSDRDDLRLERVQNVAQGLRALLEGRVRALVSGTHVARYVVQSRGLEGVKIAGKPLRSLPLVMATGPDNTEVLEAVDETLAELEIDGTLQELRTLWFGAPLNVKMVPAWVRQVLIAAGGVILLGGVLLALIVFFNRRLRTRIREATAGLEKSNRLLRTLSNCNQALVKSRSESSLLNQVCSILVTEGRAAAAWVDLAGAGDAVRSVAWWRTVAGKGGGSKNAAGSKKGGDGGPEILWEEGGLFCEASLDAMRTGGKITGLRVDEQPPSCQLRRTCAGRDGVFSLFPLTVPSGGSAGLGVLGVCSPGHWRGGGRGASGFDSEEIALLEELSGDLAYGLVSIRNTEALQRHEQELEQRTGLLEALIDTSPLAIFTLDADSSVITWNPAAERMFGWTAAEVAGRRLPTVPKERAAESKGLIRRVLSGDAFTGIEVERVRRDGSPIHLSLSTAPLRDSRGTCAGVLVIAEDVTERRSAEAERTRLEDQVRTAQKMEALGTLAGGIAHDFNNILTAVYGHAELASMSVADDDELAGHLQEILGGARRATDLTRHILAFSRQTEQEKVPVRIGPIVKEAVKLLRASVPANIEIRGAWTGQYGTVMADPTQIHQVVMNLCTNAVHAMGESGGTLEVDLSRVELGADEPPISTQDGLLPGRYLMLSVSDTGHGIQPADLPRIFEPYFTTKSAEKGTGLGLSVVHGILKGHAGAVTVDSENGQGTVFRCFIPCVEGAERSDCETQAPVRGNGERILFVDDERPIVQLAETALPKLGYTVVSANSSAEALERFRRSPEAFDLVVTDYSMPNMTGTELAREMLRIRGDLPVILCTGYSEYLSEENVGKIGIRALIMKPLLMNGLSRRIMEALGAARR